MREYTIVVQRTYIVNADSREEALENLDPFDYEDEEVVSVDWVEELERPRVL